MFDELIFKAYPNLKTMDTMYLLRRMVDAGVIQMDALFEEAVSVVGNLERSTKDGEDFKDGSDNKKVLSQWAQHRNPDIPRKRRACIGKIKNKKGWLRVAVAETLTGKAHYFKIPHSAYSDISSITITFNPDGTPEMTNHWWQWKVDSFDEVCK